MSPQVDVYAPEYQVAPQYKPDKESTWPFPAEQDGWVLAHNSIRGEMQTFKEAFQAIQKRGALKAWEVTTVKSICSLHLEHVHGHHTIEDDIFTPFLKERFHYPEKLETDHDGLVKMMNTIEEIVADLREGDKIDPLLDTWVAYESMMRPHLQEEEEVGLPLLRAYFEPHEISKLTEKVMKNASPIEIGSFIYFAGPQYIRNVFMKQEKIPFFVWYLVFRGQYNFFVKKVMQPIETLKSGVEPKATPFWSIF